MKHNKSAFTLIELLVVIAIIAILAAILFPVFASAKLAAKKASDLSNQKQAGMAQIMYCSDNDDLFAGSTWPVDNGGNPVGGDAPRWWGYNVPLGVNDPDGGQVFGYSQEAYKGVAVWTKGIAPFLKNENIMRSPVDTGGSNLYGWDWTGNPNCPGTNWQMNGGLMGASQTQVPNTAKLIMYRSVNISHRIPNANPQFYLDYGSPPQKTWASWLYYNDGNDGTFGRGSNVTWADGHASYKDTASFTYYELGNTNVNEKTAFPEGYWFVDFPWRGRPTF